MAQVTHFPTSTFEGCTSLVEVNLPKTIQQINGYSFSGCKSLKTLIIPATVTSVAWGAFQTNIPLEKVYYEGTVETWKKITISGGNTCLTNAKICYYSESGPLDSTNTYWHYVDGVPTLY